ncbi:hypothetical protein X975_20605, partial [Stegodyphus mimosarum]
IFFPKIGITTSYIYANELKFFLSRSFFPFIRSYLILEDFNASV